MRRRSGLATWVMITALGPACTRELPPPRTPRRVIPATVVDIGPPPAGAGQVVISTVGGPAQVELVTTRWGFGPYAGALSTPVCTTPCVANLPLGTSELHFTSVSDPERRGVALVTAGTSRSYLRYALGRESPHLGARIPGIVAMSVGGAAVGISSLILLASSAFGAGPPADVMTGIDIGGAAALVLGLVLVTVFRPEHQPGNGIQWVPNSPDAAGGRGVVIP